MLKTDSVLLIVDGIGSQSSYQAVLNLEYLLSIIFNTQRCSGRRENNRIILCNLCASALSYFIIDSCNINTIKSDYLMQPPQTGEKYHTQRRTAPKIQGQAP